jgi:asparagine synthase (glutamine-hydrolysing)
LLKKGAWMLNAIFQTRSTQKLNRFFSIQNNNPQANYIRRIFYFNSRDKEDLYSDTFKQRVKKNEINKTEEILERLFRESGDSDWLDQALYTDIYSYLPEDLMVKVDIASMAHSLECRSPYLDHEFMELTAKIPSSLKIKGLSKKYILRETLRPLLPSAILDRPKMGFGVPLDYWFRNELGSFLKESLLSRKALDRGLFRQEAIEKLIKEHTNKKTDNSYRLWALLFLEEWFRVWID